MTRVVIYEFLSSGGLFARPDLYEDRALRAEGAAMLSAIVADFARLPDVSLTVLVDARLTGELSEIGGVQREIVESAGAELDKLAMCARAADWTLLIAPEFDGLLLERAALVEQSGGRLLGPSAEFIRLTGDKHDTAKHLLNAGVPAPRGWTCHWPAQSASASHRATLPADVRFPAVVKPRDGCGSHGVRLVHSPAEALNHLRRLNCPARIEPFIPGVAASVALLCGTAGNISLPACRQRLSDDGQFRYLGGACPLARPLAERAQELAMRTARALPPALGYIGFDLVLGDDPSGAGDVVIEVNPRLTTSYVGLRHAVPENLAAAMLSTADGRPPRLSSPTGAVEFDATGEVRQQGSALGDVRFLSRSGPHGMAGD